MIAMSLVNYLVVRRGGVGHHKKIATLQMLFLSGVGIISWRGIVCRAVHLCCTGTLHTYRNRTVWIDFNDYR
jgi:hypothetical protein